MEIIELEIKWLEDIRCQDVIKSQCYIEEV